MSTFLSTTELERMTPQELGKELQIKRAECAKMRIGLTMQSEKNSALYRTHRREVARMTMVYKKMQKDGKNQKSEKNQTNQKSEKGISKQKSSGSSVSSVSSDSSPKASQKAKKTVKVSGSKPKKS